MAEQREPKLTFSYLHIDLHLHIEYFTLKKNDENEHILYNEGQKDQIF